MAAKINETSSSFTTTELGADCFFSNSFLIHWHIYEGGGHLSCVWQPAGGGINQRPVCSCTLLHSSGWRAALFSYLLHAKYTCKTFCSVTSPADFWVKTAEVCGKRWKGHRILLRSCRDGVCWCQRSGAFKTENERVICRPYLVFKIFKNCKISENCINLKALRNLRPAREKRKAD